jgi:hypothetical protein
VIYQEQERKRVWTQLLIPRSVADFYQEFMAALRALGIEVRISANVAT